LPVTRPEFHQDVGAEGKDFVRSWMAQFEGFSTDFAWERYKPYADLVTDVSRAASKDGVAVRCRAVLADWVSLLQRVRVVTLMAHCQRGDANASTGDRVEFADGLYHPAQIVAAMPDDYAGVLDLSVCFSLQLAPYIKRRFPHCTTIVNKGAARLDHRIAMYRQAIWLLKTGSYSYVDALAEVQLAVLRKAKVAAK
jgi:hypothetical protein